MIDFSSALYLDLRHGSAELRAWARLTTGAPAALRPPPGAGMVARSLAALQGCERGVLAPSTLHLFWDLFAILAEETVTIYADAGIYPIARWGIERARGRGVPVRVFAHHDPDALRRSLRGVRKRRPIVVVDGFCPGCGGPAPVAEYLAAARRHGGLLVLDDTQALGILGESPERGAPYGTGGGGSLRWSGIDAPDVLVASSLAKGFGVPVAALCGSRLQIRRFEARSQTRVHCSPPSAAVIRAAERALAINGERGDALRLELARRVAYVRRGLARAGLACDGGRFPVQTLRTVRGAAAVALHGRLLERGVRAVLHRGKGANGARISFLLSASHAPREIERAVRVLAAATREVEPARSGCSACAAGA